MILDNCKWLPKIVECKDYTKWNDYLEQKSRLPKKGISE